MITIKENIKYSGPGDKRWDAYTVHFANSLKEIRDTDVPPMHQSEWDEWERHYGGKSWYGVDSLSEFLKLSRSGHPEGVSAARGILRKIQSKIQRPKTMRRKRHKGEFGDEIDIHSVNSGNLSRAWTLTKRAPRIGTKKITLLIQVNAMGGTHADEMFWGPVAALALAEVLTKARYAVEIIACQPCSGLYIDNNNIHIGMIKIKDFNQPLNLSTLSLISLGGFFRHWGFKLHLLINRRIDSGGMGSTRNITKNPVRSMILEQLPRSTNPVFINRMRGEEEAIAEINRIIEKVQKEEARPVAA